MWQVRTFKVTVTVDLYSHGIAYTYLPATELLSQTGKTYPLSSHGKFVLSGGPNMVSKKQKEKKEFGFTSTSAARTIEGFTVRDLDLGNKLCRESKDFVENVSFAG